MGSLQVNCAWCGEVIGVYEPMVVVVDRQAHETSLAVEGESAELAGALRYHRACYENVVD
jgi:hypothetical protein